MPAVRPASYYTGNPEGRQTLPPLLLMARYLSSRNFVFQIESRVTQGFVKRVIASQPHHSAGTHPETGRHLALTQDFSPVRRPPDAVLKNDNRISTCEDPKSIQRQS